MENGKTVDNQKIIYYMKNFTEKLYTNYKQQIHIEKIFTKKISKYQEIMIFQSKLFGKILTLDGVIQITEKDHHPYSEMLTHVPTLSHNQIKKVLIIGGGDGAIAHECLKYSEIDEITLCEIDEEVINLSKKYLRKINYGSLNNKKVKILIKNAFEFVSNKNFKNYFDLIIVDRPDPIGPGKQLFRKIFYENIKQIMKEKGIAVFQTGVPFFQKKELKETMIKLKSIFKHSGVYLTVIPTYTGGYMALTWASNKTDIKNKKIRDNFIQDNNIKTKYYNEHIHYSSFNLPEWIFKIIT